MQEVNQFIRDQTSRPYESTDETVAEFMKRRHQESHPSEVAEQPVLNRAQRRAKEFKRKSR